jgi:hypothetical protein
LEFNRKEKEPMTKVAIFHGTEGAKLFIGLVSVMLLGSLLFGCAQTEAPAPSIIQRMQGEKVAPPPPTGFLGSDYALMTPPADSSDQKAMLRYVNPSAPWSSYSKVMVSPVTFWAADDSKVSAADQQALCNYAYSVFVKDLSKNFTVVDSPGPGVLKLSIALTDAEAATPGLRSVSVIIPQARLISAIKMAGTGTYAFVGSAQGEGKITDSQSGLLLAAFEDKRVGGTSVTNVTVFQWGDADHIIDYWAETLDQRMVSMGVVQHPGTVSAN